MSRKLSRRLALTLSLTAGPWVVAAVPPSRPAAITAGDERAAAAGLEILAAGGNAADAAVAAALALAVVYPEAGNLGGGGFALVRSAGEVAALDFREVAPAAATATMYLDARGEPRPGASRYGPLAAAVPGSPAGYFELHRRFGRLPWRRVVGPALALAAAPVEISARTAATLAADRDRLRRFPETAAVWLRGGKPPGWGERLELPGLAATLERYAAAGPAGIQSGPVAQAIESASRRHGGILTAADLAAYRPVWREPLRFERFGWSFAAMPLPSSGGFILGEALGLLERLEWLALPAESPARAHLLAEVLRSAFADRFRLGDPDLTPHLLDELLVPTRLDRLAGRIDRRRATPSATFGTPPRREPGETTHLSVIDGEGMTVALTTTLNELYGCGLWVAGAGFFLNDQMDDFTTAAGRPNEYGLIQGEGNAIAPGRRPLSSMAPTIAWREGETIALGGRGGSRIPSAILQVFLALLEGDGARAAVARPRLHHQWLPDQLEHEAGALDDDATNELARRGHRLVAAKDLPKVNLVRRLADGSLEAAGDPRAGEVGLVAP